MPLQIDAYRWAELGRGVHGALATAVIALLVGGCATTAPEAPPAPAPVAPDAGPVPDESPPSTAIPRSRARPAPGRARTPADLAVLPDPVPRYEPLSVSANQPYTLFGRHYVPMTERQPWRQRGVASWYGPRFHGQRTATGERYDMYTMTAAHPTLPLPSFVRVRHVVTGRSIVVRVNDRGPYRYGRALDLSYAAACKLGFHGQGTAEVEIELITSFPGMPADTSAVKGTIEVFDELASADADRAMSTGDAQPIGSFSSRSMADAMRARVATEFDWPLERLDVVPLGGAFILTERARSAAADR